MQLGRRMAKPEDRLLRRMAEQVEMRPCEVVAEYHPRRLPHERGERGDRRDRRELERSRSLHEHDRAHRSRSGSVHPHGYPVARIAGRGQQRAVVDLWKCVGELLADAQRFAPGMRAQPASIALDQHTVVAEDCPAAARERVGQRRLAAPAVAGEEPGATLRVDDTRCVNEVASALPQPDDRADARKLLPTAASARP